MTTYTTTWGSDTIEITADFTQAADQVIGDAAGRQVADFQHRPEQAMRAVLEDVAQADGLDICDPDTTELIDEAVAGMAC